MLCFTRVKLTSFGRFRDAEFALKPGLNLIRGGNEAGKSTMVSAIAGVVFGFRRERERYFPWEEKGRCEAEVAFSHGDREMVICRDFITDKVRAVEREGRRTVWRFEGKVSPAGRSSEREEYLAKIEEIWGFSEGDIFRNSVYVGQRDLPIDGHASLGARLQQLLSGFSELDCDGVVADLEKELYGITKKPGGRSKDRELEEVRARLAELSSLWQRGRETLAELERHEAKIAELSLWLENARVDREKGERYLERVRRCHELAARRKALAEEFSRIDGEREKVERLLAEKTELETRLLALKPVASLPDDFPLVLQSREEAAAKLAGLEEEIRAAEASLEPTGRWSVSRAIAAVLALWVLAAVAASLRPHDLAIPAVAIVGLSLLMTLPAARRYQERRMSGSRRAGRLDALRAEMAAVRKSVADWESRFPDDGTLDASGGAHLLKEFHAARRAREELARVESAVRVLPDHPPLLVRARELAQELAVISERLEGIAGKGFPLLSCEEFIAAEEKMRRLEGEIREKEALLRRHEQDIAVIRHTSPDLGVIEDEGEELRGRETRLAKRAAALQLAVELLRETVEEYRASYLARLGRVVGGKLFGLTSGRYREAAFDADFGLSLVAGGDLRPVLAMSCGVQDQAFLAARLALGAILSRGKKLPFLLDDPLVNFDSERRGAALKALDRIAGEHQVLLFVHDDRYVSAKGSEGWHTIMLENRRGDSGQLHLL